MEKKELIKQILDKFPYLDENKLNEYKEDTLKRMYNELTDMYNDRIDDEEDTNNEYECYE